MHFSGFSTQTKSNALISNEQLTFILTTADQRVLKEARIFEEDCKHDINSIIECSECFQNWLKDRVGYFLEVCAKPHLLAMVKLGKTFFFEKQRLFWTLINVSAWN